MKKSYAAAALSLCFLAGVGAVLLLWHAPLFVIYNRSKHRLIYANFAGRISSLHYRYCQSYDRGIIDEIFQIADGGFIPVSITFDTDSYDYHGSRYPGMKLKKKGEKFIGEIITPPVYPLIRYRIGYTINQSLEITALKKRKIFYKEAGDSGDLLIVTLLKRKT